MSWASDQSVPAWFDLAREFTETWVHHQQVRHAVGLGTDRTRLPTVLTTFAWALPHQYRVPADTGTRVVVDLDCGGAWELTSDGGGRWSLTAATAPPSDALVRFTGEAAWRSFVGEAVIDSDVMLTGPPTLTQPVLQIRAIITEQAKP